MEDSHLIHTALFMARTIRDAMAKNGPRFRIEAMNIGVNRDIRGAGFVMLCEIDQRGLLVKLCKTEIEQAKERGDARTLTIATRNLQLALSHQAKAIELVNIGADA